MTLIILILELWCLAGLVLALHRISARTGLGPLLVWMGGLVGLLQLPGPLNLTFDTGWFTFRFTSHLLLPVLLLGLLVIYIVNGSTRARFTLAGMVLFTALAATFQILYPLHTSLPGSLLPDVPASLYSLRKFLSSAVTISADMVALIVVYQAVSNLRRRYPSRTAATAALLAALWTDALLYPTLMHAGTPAWAAYLSNDLIGKTLPAVALWPLVSIYLKWVAPSLPNTAANMPRPTLDLFTTQLQLEARARYHYGLLRTLSEINQLILRTNDPKTLIEKACSLLATGREYSLAWIGLLESDGQELNARACSGPSGDFARDIRLVLHDPEEGDHPALQALASRSSVTIDNVATYPTGASWRVDAFRAGLLSQAAFPLRHGSEIYGVLSVHTRRANAFDAEEVTMLQELADDLAYALTSLEARRQHLLLHTSAENMRDGLLIVDLEGKVVYANPVLCAAVGESLDRLQGQSLTSFLPPQVADQFIQEYVPAIERDGRFSMEMEFEEANGDRILAAVNASRAYDAATGQSHIVINVRDGTQRKRYEHQLLTLNHLTADLVQIHEPTALLSAILHACEDLLQADASAVYMLAPGLTPAAPPTPLGELAAHHLPGQVIWGAEHIFERFVRQLGSPPVAPALIQGKDGQDRELSAELTLCGYSSLLLLPIRYQQQSLGLMGLFFARRRVFQEEELQLGSTVAHSLAIVLQNAHLYQAEHNQRQMAEALAQAGMILNSSLDLDQVLDHILEGTVNGIVCQTVNLMLIEGDTVRIVRHYDPTDRVESQRSITGMVLPLNTPTLKKMLVDKEPLLMTNTLHDDLWSSLPGTDWIRSYAAAPLEVRDQVIGFLNINSSLPNAFNQVSLQQLKAFAAAAATAIQNASMYQDLQQHSLELEDRVRDRTAELRAAKERIEAILVSVPDAVFVLDDANALIQANPAGETLLTQANQAGISLFAPGFLASLQDGPHPNEKAILEVQGRAYQALASSLKGAGITRAGNDRAGSVIVFRDVTRFRELDKMKSQFVSDVSHELRTPLTNMTLYLDLLAHNLDSGRRVSYMATLRRETERLTHLIEDLLTISRLEAEREQVRIKPVNIVSLVKDLALDRSPMAASRGLQLEWTTQPGLPRAQADPRLLTQVLSNLLTNALNYTPAPGQICIHLGTGKRDDFPASQDWVTVAINDTGVGIPAKELLHIFERFYRGEAGRKTGASGTGLGLAISREMIERMKGLITVESTPGVGSTFTVWLQAAEGEDEKTGGG